MIIDTFLKTAKIWKVILIAYVISFTCTYLAFTVSVDMTGNHNALITHMMVLILSLLISAPILPIIFILVFSLRQSTVFWRAAQILESNMLNANSLEELDKLYSDDFVALKYLASSKAHFEKLLQLTIVMKKLGALLRNVS